MGHIRLKRNPEIEIALRRNARARRMTLRVSSFDGRVTMTVPKRASLRDAERFAEEKAGWIAAALDRRPEETVVGPGALVPVEGLLRRVRPERRRGIALYEEEIRAPAGREGSSIRAWMTALARERIAGAVDRHAAALGHKPGRITLRDTRSRWGSCSYEGNLNFSWRLIMAPPEALDYVAAHEVAHLAHMDHSPAFWAAVARLMPDFEGPRRWLRTEGGALHRYRFE